MAVAQVAVFVQGSQKVCHTLAGVSYGAKASALESPDPGASNGGSDFQIRHFGAEMAAIEVAGWPRISNLSQVIERPKFVILNRPATSNASMSAPKCRICKFDPPFDAPGSELSSALRISVVRQAYDRMPCAYTIFFEKTSSNSQFRI